MRSAAQQLHTLGINGCIGKHAITQRVGRGGGKHTTRASRWHVDGGVQPNKKHMDARHLFALLVLVKQDDGHEATTRASDT